MCVDECVGVFVSKQIIKRCVCASACKFVQECISVCLCVCASWHIWVLQSIIALKVAIETLSLSHMATDTGLHLIYT